MATAVFLPTILALATANTHDTPFLHGQLLIPIFQHQLYQQLFHNSQYDDIDRSDQQNQEQNLAFDYANNYYQNVPADENNGNLMNQEAEWRESNYDYDDQKQPKYMGFLDSNEDSGGDRQEGSYYQQQMHQPGYMQTYPVAEHVEVTKPVAMPVYKEIGIPVPRPFRINVPHPVTVGVPQPYPVAVPVSHPVPIQVIKTIAVPVEKKVPYPIEKQIPVPVEKRVPFTIEKHIPVPVYKPYPIRIPVYKTIYHDTKSYSNHGHRF